MKASFSALNSTAVSTDSVPFSQAPQGNSFFRDVYSIWYPRSPSSFVMWTIGFASQRVITSGAQVSTTFRICLSLYPRQFTKGFGMLICSVFLQREVQFQNKQIKMLF
ncbi:Hypothetical_protein [Hexamita inflata]|uniref:Hypothetical_protein n=1 Tax=Hexamita inflata TaxID=28002 RepID=A0AA86UKF4_9EUKA|nr:Hypothetical protein HINF_LOCUS30678 [Hexamita inflata]